jgi:hypothetical protein
VAVLDPKATTALDLCTEALNELGIISLGQTPSQADLTFAQSRLQWMLQQWQQQRLMVWHLRTLVAPVATGRLGYTLGPGGMLDTGAGPRPARVASAFLRQYTGAPGADDPGASGAIGLGAIGRMAIGLGVSTTPTLDYPLDQLQSREDYNRVRIKNLGTLSRWFFYDSAWPLGVVMPWPVPPGPVALQRYALHVSVPEVLPAAFAVDGSTQLVIPFEYYQAMLTNLALRMRPRYRVPTFPGDPLPVMAKSSLEALRGDNFQVPRLVMPGGLGRRGGGGYNIFGDIG